MRFEIVELDDIDGRPAFFTERDWAPNALCRYECGEDTLPDRCYWQGASVCDDPVAIVPRRPS